jgi:hypothetical protein
MTMYLLLRNNKQSGPYSLDELKNMGMKAYDLVWLEGKSAAWRYPSEIEELKEFAPAVEEQPFDRFYKRPGATTATATTVASGTSATNGNKETTTVAFRPASETSKSGESSPATGKRIIYVTLPAGRSAPAPVRETTVRESPVRESPTRETPVREMPLRETVTSISAIGDYPSLSGDRTLSPVEFSPRSRSHKNERLVRFAGIGIGILALLVAGIFIGLSLNRDTLGLQKRIASGNTSASQAKPAGASLQPGSFTATGNTVPVNTTGKPGTADKTTASAGNNAAPLAVDNKKKLRRQKEKVPAVLAVPVQKDSGLDIPAGSREAIHRTVAEQSSAIDTREAVKTAITSEVSVGASRYSVGTFGGINDLQLTVTNRSAYPLDLVVVEVQYIQANKKIYKTENLSFRDIGPGAALMQVAPKSSRGIRVQYKITSINSKELGLSYSGL